jgi:hypothetical protein
MDSRLENKQQSKPPRGVHSRGVLIGCVFEFGCGYVEPTDAVHDSILKLIASGIKMSPESADVVRPDKGGAFVLYRNCKNSRKRAATWRAIRDFRTDIWKYAGSTSFKKNPPEELARNSTVKPVQILTDAIKDISGP